MQAGKGGLIDGCRFVVVFYNTKYKTMNNNEKLAIMDKIIRELEDINNSSTSLLKKVSQVETENINLGDKLLEDKLPDLHEKIDAMVTESATLIADYTEVRDKFYSDNNMGAAAEGL
jgi:hypothetical protein